MAALLIPGRVSKLAVAVHEAGHAVVQMASGGPWIESVSVVDQPDGKLGIVNSEPRWKSYFSDCSLPDDPKQAAVIRDAWTRAAWQDVLHFLAGPLAEMRWRCRSRWVVIFSCDANRETCFADPPPDRGGDLGQVRARLDWAFPDDPQEAFKRAWSESEELVHRHWRSIVAVGRLLRIRGKLDNEELRAAAGL